MNIVETQTFKTRAECIKWMKRVHKGQYLIYDRAPVGQQDWVYGDGHVAHMTLGEHGGTFLKNLPWILGIVEKGLHGPGTVAMFNDIDTRGGVTLTIRWE